MFHGLKCLERYRLIIYRIQIGNIIYIVSSMSKIWVRSNWYYMVYLVLGILTSSDTIYVRLFIYMYILGPAALKLSFVRSLSCVIPMKDLPINLDFYTYLLVYKQKFKSFNYHVPMHLLFFFYQGWNCIFLETY